MRPDLPPLPHEREVYEKIRDACIDKGYDWFDGGAFDLNLILLRRPGARTFDDVLFCCFTDDVESPRVFAAPCTTVPGVPGLKQPVNPKGALVLPYGQHRGIWKLGLHKRTRPALVQARAIEVLRDDDRNEDIGPLPGSGDLGWHGMNLHGTKEHEPVVVGPWSLGCTVIPDDALLAEFLELCRGQVERHPKWVTYSATVMDVVDVWPEDLGR